MAAVKRLIFPLAALFFLLVEAAAASSEPDHLLPADRSHNRAYFDLLNRKLNTTPFDFGRIVVRPPFTGEYSISIYGEPRQDQGVRHHIKLKRAEESLWQASLGGVEPMKAEDVKVSEADVVITPELAQLLRKVLSAMVDQTKPLGAAEQLSKIVIEGPLTEVMIIGHDQKVEIGEMGTFPPSAPKLSLLTELITNLTRLCDEGPSERARLLTKVTDDANALQRQLAGDS